MSTGCPHAEAQYCPLYIAQHDPRLMRFGCDDGQLEHKGCGADRGSIDYSQNLRALTDIDRAMVQDCLFREMGARARAQRDRNLRLNGIR